MNEHASKYLGTALALAANASVPSSASAETTVPPAPTPASERTWSVSAKAGFLMSGSAYVDAGDFEGEVDTEGGLAVVAGADAVVAPRLSVGGFGFVASTDEVRIMTVGGTIKGRFAAGSSVQVRPGVAIGYQSIDIEGADSTTGFDIGAFVEVALARPGKRTEWLAEVGFITQPSGGNSDIDLTFGPIFYVTAGIGFGN